MNNSTPLWVRVIPPFIRQRLTGRVELQKIIANTGWIFADRVIQIIVNLFAGVWVARYLGPEQRGVMLYAIAFVELFLPLSTMGLGGILVRELVREPEAKNILMGTVFTVQILGYVLLLPCIISSVMVLRSGDVRVQQAVLILALGYLFATSRVFEFWFRSQLQSKYTAWAMNLVGFVVAGFKILLILIGAPLMTFVTLAALQVAFGFASQLFFYLRIGERIRAWRFSLARAKALVRDSWPLALSLLATDMYMRIDSVMLGQLADDRAVGIYGEAARLAQTWYFIPFAIASSVYPTLVRARQTQATECYHQRVQSFFDVLAAIGYIFAIPAALAAPALISALYGPDYTETGTVLSIYVWTFIFVSLRYGMNHWLMVENMTRLTMWAAILGAIVNIALNVWMIPLYGVTGAAWATLIASAVSVYLVGLLSSRLRPLFRQLVLALLVPFRLRSLFARK